MRDGPSFSRGLKDDDYSYEVYENGIKKHSLKDDEFEQRYREVFEEINNRDQYWAEKSGK